MVLQGIGRVDFLVVPLYVVDLYPIDVVKFKPSPSVAVYEVPDIVVSLRILPAQCQIDEFNITILAKVGIQFHQFGL